jgi:hypothetical protein
MNTKDITLSIDRNGLRLLYQGLPLCNDKQSLDEIYLVAKMYKCNLPATAWNGERGEWVSTSTITT